MKNNKTSILISTILGVVFFIGLAVSCFWVPTFVDSMLAVPDNFGLRNDVTPLGKTLIIADIYSIIAVGEIAIVFMFFLLKRVSLGKVFTKITGDILNIVSLCCFAEGILALLLIFCFQVVICAAFAAFFLGFCLLVVKNVINEGTRIKNENDFTIWTKRGAFLWL